MNHNQSFIYLYTQTFTECLFYAKNCYFRHWGKKDKNGTISILRKLTLKICREQSPRKSIGLAELGRHIFLPLRSLCFGPVRTPVRGVRTLSAV